MKMEQTCRLSRWQLLKQQLNNLDPADFGRQLEQCDEVILLDVRTPAEYHDWSMPEAINIDYLSYNLADQLEELDKEKNYFVYCRTGRRSIRVCMLLQNSGFEKVYNLEGGLMAWNDHFGSDQ